MVVVVCGGRGQINATVIDNALTAVHQSRNIALLIEGGGPGADTLCRTWARERDIPVETIPADWDVHGKEAGPLRNTQMLERNPDLLIAFPGGEEASDCVRQAQGRGIMVFSWPES